MLLSIQYDGDSMMLMTYFIDSIGHVDSSTKDYIIDVETMMTTNDMLIIMVIMCISYKTHTYIYIHM